MTAGAPPRARPAMRALGRLRLHGLAAQWPFLVSLLLLLGAWEVIGRTKDFLYLPPVSRVLQTLWLLLGDGTIARELRASLAALAGGMTVAILGGVVIGAFMGLSPLVEYALDVYLDAAMAAPMVAFVPIFILVFGLGYVTRIVTVTVFAFFPVVVNTFAGIRVPSGDLIQMARSFGATPRQLFWRVRLPIAYAHISAGIQVGIARGVDGLITGEVLIAATGLGGLVTRFGHAFTMDRLWAVVLAIVVLALIASQLARAAGTRLVQQ